MGSSSGSQPVTQQTTQTKDPWGPAQPHLQNVMNSAANLIGGDVGYQPYYGQTQANLHPWISNAMTGISSPLWNESTVGDSNTIGTPGVQAARQSGLGLIQNYGMSPEMQNLYNEASTTENPYLQNILNTQGRQISERVNSAMAGSGRYGSGQHTDVLARALAESADPILAQDYTRRQQQRQALLEGGLQRQGQWSQLMPQLDDARFQSARTLMGLGQYMTDREQQALQQQLALYNQQQARPWEQLQRYNALVGGAGSLGGTQVTSIPGATQPSTLQRILGGATAGAGIGTMFGPGIGTGIGALGGGLLGMMG